MPRHPRTRRIAKWAGLVVCVLIVMAWVASLRVSSHSLSRRRRRKGVRKGGANATRGIQRLVAPHHLIVGAVGQHFAKRGPIAAEFACGAEHIPVRLRASGHAPWKWKWNSTTAFSSKEGYSVSALPAAYVTCHAGCVRPSGKNDDERCANSEGRSEVPLSIRHLRARSSQPRRA